MESTHSKRDIFVVADDLGLDPTVNEGIFFAFKNDLINGVSLMANGSAFDHAISEISRLEVQLPNIGVHLVLIEEKSILGREQIPTLLSARGGSASGGNNQRLLYKNHKIFFIRYILGLIKKDEIMKEIEAQIQKILGTGIKPEFINSHQHLHLLPGIMNIVISLAKKYGVPYIRIVNEPLMSKGGLFRKAQLCFLRFLSGTAKNKIIQSGLKCNDIFVGFINAGNLSEEDLQKARELKDKYPNKIIELGCHPGFESPALVKKYSHWRYHWGKELEILKKTINYD